MARECPKCMADLPRKAAYCPRCGVSVADVPDSDLLAATRHARREVIVGWLLFLTGGVLALLALFGVTRGRGWVIFGIGASLFIVGLGTLVGNESTPNRTPKRRKKKRKADGEPS